jgi:hypothetical protein
VSYLPQFQPAKCLIFKVQERSHVSFKSDDSAIHMVLSMQWVAGVMLLDIGHVLNAFAGE